MCTLSTISTPFYQSSTTMLSRLRLPQELLDSAKERLLGQDPPAEGVVLARSISLESYQKFCEAEKNLPVKIRLVNGEVVAYEVPLGPHGTAASQVCQQISRWCYQ